MTTRAAHRRVQLMIAALVFLNVAVYCGRVLLR